MVALKFPPQQKLIPYCPSKVAAGRYVKILNPAKYALASLREANKDSKRAPSEWGIYLFSPSMGMYDRKIRCYGLV